MNNLTKLISVFFILTFAHTAAQDFAPVGAQWYYTENLALSGDKGFLKIESVKDTLFQGKNCKLLYKTGILQCSSRLDTTEIVYSQDSAVYFWDNDFGKFQKLYDFKAATGSYWPVLVKRDNDNTDTIRVVIDSITTTEILNKTHKVLNVSYYPSYLKGYHYSSNIVYSFGDRIYLFNFYPYRSMVCDFNYSGGLRCYEDTEFGYYSTGIAESCTYRLTGIKTIPDNALKVVVTPNPARDNIKISCNNRVNHKMYLLDYSGKTIITCEFAMETRIDISAYPKGVYFIFIRDESGQTTTTKIMKR